MTTLQHYADQLDSMVDDILDKMSEKCTTLQNGFLELARENKEAELPLAEDWVVDQHTKYINEFDSQTFSHVTMLSKVGRNGIEVTFNSKTALGHILVKLFSKLWERALKAHEEKK